MCDVAFDTPLEDEIREDAFELVDRDLGAVHAQGADQSIERKLMLRIDIDGSLRVEEVTEERREKWHENTAIVQFEQPAASLTPS